MLDTWIQKYSQNDGQINLAGWCFESEDECETYLAERVKAKILQSDSTTVLQEYLVEMTDTGFNTSTLQTQIERPPKAKDWEIGEAFAEVMLEDKFEAFFPWPTSWDKRTPKASLPGPDMPGFHRKSDPIFLFGEVKSSSEVRVPPQVVNSGDDCLCKQVNRLLSSETHRQQLIGWLLVRAKDSTRWKPIFDNAMERYAAGEACICGVLVSGGREPTLEDLSLLQDAVTASAGTYNMMFLAFYLPFEKLKWVELVYGTESVN